MCLASRVLNASLRFFASTTLLSRFIGISLNGKLKLRDETSTLVLRRLPFVLGIYPYNLTDLLRQVHDDTLVFEELH